MVRVTVPVDVPAILQRQRLKKAIEVPLGVPVQVEKAAVEAVNKIW
jgi:hypothetical protein